MNGNKLYIKNFLIKKKRTYNIINYTNLIKH